MVPRGHGGRTKRFIIDLASSVAMWDTPRCGPTLPSSYSSLVSTEKLTLAFGLATYLGFFRAAREGIAQVLDISPKALGSSSRRPTAHGTNGQDVSGRHACGSAAFSRAAVSGGDTGSGLKQGRGGAMLGARMPRPTKM